MARPLGFDDIGIYGSLPQEYGIRMLFRLALKNIYEKFADCFSFYLRIGNTLKAGKKPFLCIDDDQMCMNKFRKNVSDPRIGTRSHKPGVNIDRDKIFPYRLPYEECGYR